MRERSPIQHDYMLFPLSRAPISHRQRPPTGDHVHHATKKLFNGIPSASFDDDVAAGVIEWEPLTRHNSHACTRRADVYHTGCESSPRRRKQLELSRGPLGFPGYNTRYVPGTVTPKYMHGCLRPFFLGLARYNFNTLHVS